MFQLAIVTVSKRAMAVVSNITDKITTFKPVVMSGPSGAGKSTLLKKLMEEFPNCFAFSVSHTTRKPRRGEENGKDYHFVSREEMTKAIANKDFIEYAEFSGNLYGTSKQAVGDVGKTGKICILDIDIQGVKSIKKTDLKARYIFIQPPNVTALEERLRARGTETEETIQRRMETAKEALNYAHDGKDVYDHIIVNENVEVAYENLKGFLFEDICQINNKDF